MRETEVLTRTRFDLAGYWSFKVDPEGTGEKRAWNRGLPLDSDLLWVPANWNEQVPDYAWYDGVAWYERRFVLPHLGEGALYLSCEGILVTSEAWVNGRPAGGNEGGYLPFTLKASGLKVGEENSIVIRVDSRDNPRLPSFRGDFFNYGGIYRDIYLERLPAARISDVVIRTGKRGETGTVEATVSFACESAEGYRGALVATLVDPEGREVTFQEVPVSFGPAGGGPADLQFEVRSARFWSPDSPMLYRLVCRLRKSNALTDIQELAVGIRKAEVRRDGFYLNDRRTFLFGFSRHECFPVLGKSVKGAVLRREMAAMKGLGANVFRTSHYPHCRETYELADRLGLMVIDELSFQGGSAAREGKAEVRERGKELLGRLIGRDRNHPSVIMWSVANEPEDVVPEVAEFVRQLMAHARSLDSTRPVTMQGCDFDWAGDPDAKGADIIEDLAIGDSDLLDIHNYPGWYDNCGQLDRGVAKFSKIIDILHRKHGKPVFVGEFGAEGVIGLHADPPEMWTEEYQAEAIRKVIEMLLAKDFVAGFMIWNLADFRTGQSPLRVMQNRKGVLTRTKDPKLAAMVVRGIFQKIRQERNQ